MAVLSGIFNISQAAEALGVARMTVHRWINDRKIDTIEIAGSRFITQSEIDRINKEKGESQKTE
jgi:excisionase family DNA binding protein